MIAAIDAWVISACKRDCVLRVGSKTFRMYYTFSCPTNKRPELLLITLKNLVLLSLQHYSTTEFLLDYFYATENTHP